MFLAVMFSIMCGKLKKFFSLVRKRTSEYLCFMDLLNFPQQFESGTPRVFHIFPESRLIRGYEHKLFFFVLFWPDFSRAQPRPQNETYE